MTNYTEQTWTNSGIERMIVFFYCSVPGFQLFCLGLHWVWVALEPHALSKRENGTQLKELGVEESMVYLTNSEVFLHLLNYQPQWSMVHHAACFNSPEESECSYKFLVAVQSTATSLAFSETGSKSIQPPKQSKHGCMHMYIYIYTPFGLPAPWMLCPNRPSHSSNNRSSALSMRSRTCNCTWAAMTMGNSATGYRTSEELPWKIFHGLVREASNSLTFCWWAILGDFPTAAVLGRSISHWNKTLGQIRIPLK